LFGMSVNRRFQIGGDFIILARGHRDIGRELYHSINVCHIFSFPNFILS
jgi:hypothetical protein